MIEPKEGLLLSDAEAALLPELDDEWALELVAHVPSGELPHLVYGGDCPPNNAVWRLVKVES